MTLPLLLAPLLAIQVGPNASLPARDGLPPEILERKSIEQARRAQSGGSQGAAEPEFAPSRGCTSAMLANPDAGAVAARSALARAKGEERVRAGLCLGTALVALERWDEAQRVFVEAREGTGIDDHASRARLGAMAGNAALAGGRAADGLPLLTTAVTDARLAKDPAMEAGAEIDRARALVALKRGGEAAQALANARALQPGNAQGWLLSATLARRESRLAEAQAMIEKAAAIDPADPEIGLEAGVVAVLAGREDAARLSWRSVVATAPQSAAAQTARGYLAQIGEPVSGTASPQKGTP